MSKAARRISTPLPYYGKLAVANLITDDTRLAGVEGDGATYPDSSAGVWPAATNLCANGGFETNTTGWTAWASGASMARVTTEAKFGSASLQLTVTGGISRGARATVDSLSASAAHAASAWVKAPSGADLKFVVYDTPITTALATTVFAGTGDWQRVTATFTSDADGGTHYLFITTNSDIGAVVFYVDGVQLETGSIATPYIETDGGTASRSAGRITLPASGIFTTTQGWFIARVKTGFAAAGPGYVPRMMSYGDAVDNGLWLAYDGGNWSIVSDASGGVGSVSAVSADGGLATSDSRTVYGGWKSDRVNVTKGTTAWPAGTARTEVPTVASAVIDIGSLSAWLTGREAACAFKWVAMGDGPYTAIDPSVVGNWGNNDPLPHMFPKSAQLTFLDPFNGDGTFYRRSA